MSQANLAQDSSGKLERDTLLEGTVSPNGKMCLYFEESHISRNIWQKEFVSFPPYRKDLKLSVSPKYPFGIGIYSPGRISLGKTAELCKLFYDEIIEESRRRGLHLDFGPGTLQEANQELEVIRRHIRIRTP